MALSRIPLPSFTLVLTSDPQSFHRDSTDMRLNYPLSPAMLPAARDHLMQTIDLRGEPDDSNPNSLNKPTTRIDYDCIRLQTIFEEEEPSAVDKKQAAGIAKQYALMFLHSLRRKLVFFVNGTVPVRPITN